MIRFQGPPIDATVWEMLKARMTALITEHAGSERDELGLLAHAADGGVVDLVFERHDGVLMVVLYVAGPESIGGGLFAVGRVPAHDLGLEINPHGFLVYTVGHDDPAELQRRTRYDAN
ncbi:MAG: hypothetical protein AB7L13_07175 [Acidimicrobiia bacterium]